MDIRADLVKNNYNFWKNLETPYEFFYKIKELKEEINPEIVVISKKNKASIVERFNSYDFKLNPDKIFAREFLANYSTKGEFMEEYMQKNNFSSAIFVDDNINNLKTSENNPKIKNILASWGNTEPNTKGYTQKEAINEILNYFNSK